MRKQLPYTPECQSFVEVKRWQPGAFWSFYPNGVIGERISSARSKPFDSLAAGAWPRPSEESLRAITPKAGCWLAAWRNAARFARQQANIPLLDFLLVVNSVSLKCHVGPVVPPVGQPWTHPRYSRRFRKARSTRSRTMLVAWRSASPISCPRASAHVRCAVWIALRTNRPSGVGRNSLARRWRGFSS